MKSFRSSQQTCRSASNAAIYHSRLRVSRINLHREAAGVNSARRKCQLVRHTGGSIVDLISRPMRRTRKIRQRPSRDGPSAIRASIPPKKIFEKKKDLPLLSASRLASLLRNVFFTLLGAEGSTYFRPRRNSDRRFFILASPSELQEPEKCRYITCPTQHFGSIIFSWRNISPFIIYLLAFSVFRCVFTFR